MTPIRELIYHPRNDYHEGDVGAISSLIEKNGWHGTVVVNKRTNHICAGNHRVKAAAALGMDTVPVYWIDVDDETELRILVADNRATRLARDNDKELAEILGELRLSDNLPGTGYDQDDLDDLLARIERNDKAKMDESSGSGEGTKSNMVTCPNCEFEFPAQK